MKFRIILSLLLIVNTLYSNDIIKIIPPQSAYDSSHSYFSNLLTLMLNDETTNTKIAYSYQMEQGRAFAQLKQNKDIDVYWAGTSLQREKEFNAIKIPLLKGLLGYRVLVINKKNKKLFENIKNIDDLKKLKACQGRHWPDTEILENSDFKVIKNSNYESMFLQVLKGRCDYFPRGIHEGYSELESRKDKYEELMIFDKIIIYYPFPMYFFVSKENVQLAQKIEDGLLRIIENKSFENYIQTNTITKHLFPLSKWNTKTIYEINNHLLSLDTDFHNQKFWIIPHKNDQNIEK